MPRPRVVAAVLEALERHALVQLVAPAGAGKTTALLQAAEELDRPVAWLTLDEWHRSPGLLASGVAYALDRVSGGLADEAARAQAGGAGPPELAALVCSLARDPAVLVVDDCHVVVDSKPALDVLASVARRASSTLRVVLVSRSPLPLTRISVDARAPESTIGYELLRATPDEAEAVLRNRGRPIEVDDAIDATDGWIAGLLFETWRSPGVSGSGTEGLEQYLGSEVLAQLSPEAGELLIASCLFDTVDAKRAEALGAQDPLHWLATLRNSGLPAVWSKGEAEMRLHRRIRELLREALDTRPERLRRSIFRAAASAYERESDPELALELYLQADAVADVARLLPDVILDVVHRQDVELADRYLAAARLEPESATVVMARLALASIRASHAEFEAALEPVLAAGRLGEAIAERPEIGAFVCNFLAGIDGERAAEVLVLIPPGRAADVARLTMSGVRDDPDSPIPSFTGDFLDAILARALWARGRLGELRASQTRWAEVTGVLPISTGFEAGRAESTLQSEFLRELARFTHAVGLRDAKAAASSVSTLRRGGRGVMALLAEAELAVRLERDPSRAHRAVAELRALDVMNVVFFSEATGVWDGAAALLDDDPVAAATTLRATVASMRRGDRTLVMPTALVYLAEAEWRLGNGDDADRYTDEAYAVARAQGSLRGLLLSLGDFPGVLSRRIDAEPSADTIWHSLGRTLVAGTGEGASAAGSGVVVHVREFGNPGIILGDRIMRPKIRKSLELLSYLLASGTEPVTREEVLTALWNGRDDASTRSYLRQALRHLREALPTGVSVSSAGDALRVEGVVVSESLELLALTAQASREEGPRRLGVLLEGLEIAERGMFLEGSRDVRWVDERRDRIESLVSDLRLDCAESLLEAERYLQALALADAAIERSPLVERAWRVRMRALGMLGDHDGVVAAFHACANALAEIGLEPSASTRKLVGALRH